MGERVRAAFDMERALAHALGAEAANGPLAVFLQPQVNAAGELHGFEALLRWIDPQQGMISPVQFIPVAEQSGLILPLGQWVLDRACFYLGQLARAGQRVGIAVNVSQRQFKAPDFVEQVRQTLARHGVAADQLVLELTESLMMEDPEGASAIMRELTGLGVRFSIDDFGTGYSSLAYLKRLPIHELKIDRSFIRDLPEDGDDGAIVGTILAMARHLRLRVVAEGVETWDQVRFLRQQDAAVIMQGFLYGRPEAAEAWLARLDEGLRWTVDHA